MKLAPGHASAKCLLTEERASDPLVYELKDEGRMSRGVDETGGMHDWMGVHDVRLPGVELGEPERSKTVAIAIHISSRQSRSKRECVGSGKLKDR